MGVFLPTRIACKVAKRNAIIALLIVSMTTDDEGAWYAK